MEKATERATIDVVAVTITTKIDDVVDQEIYIDTANKIGVEVASETTDAVKLIIKGVLKAQKKALVTVTGHTITLTDNVMNFKLAKILQGGTITYDTLEPTLEIGYTPPIVGSVVASTEFELAAYSAVYDTGGDIIEYEKIVYPNCTGNPFSMSSEDGAFRAQELVINSAPNTGEAPYTISIVAVLPALI
ncbi:hypothetical protein [Clostridium sp.]|uniref:hypothetical protein n=1 Tax=Clostridium sp. TaxID=1506 RepID=UPI001A3E91DF|nr:hypothetical protein [Clostridium sp.]MBK5234048.1 hypothetical protein [Clostridium sp.]